MVVIQSMAGDSVITSVYSRDRTAVMIGFAVLYLAILCIVGGKKGLRGALGLVLRLVQLCMFIFRLFIWEIHRFGRLFLSAQ